MANILNTRIRLKYDTLSNWTTANPVLLAGEIAIATITSGATQEVNSVTAPQVLFKVGNGTSNFNSLPFASGKAADVYTWAKEASMAFTSEATQSSSGDKTYTGNAVTGIEWDATLNNNKGGLKFIKGTQFATKAELDAALAAFDGEIGSITDTDTRYSFEVSANGKLGVTEVKYVNGSAEGNGTTSYYDFVTPEELTTILGDYYTKTEVDNIVTNYYTKDEVDELVQDVRDAIPTEVGVMSVAGSGAVTASGTKDVTVGLSLDNSGNVVLSQGASGLKATVDLSAYRLIADDQDTKYGIEYDSTNKVIKLTNNPAQASISAADFVKDGMLQSVVVDNAANTITFTWNTDGGVTETVVKLSDIADIYTAAAGASEVQVAISNTNEISATLVNGGVSEEKLAEGVKTKLNKTWEEVGVAKGLVDGLNISQYQTKNLSTTIANKGTVEDAMTEIFNTASQASSGVSAIVDGSVKAKKAEQDANGNVITDTYLTKNDAASTYVAKETGKGLSSNDFTTAEKTKLESLSNYDDSGVTGRLDAIEAKKVVEYYEATEPNPDNTPVFIIYCGDSAKVM